MEDFDLNNIFLDTSNQQEIHEMQHFFGNNDICLVMPSFQDDLPISAPDYGSTEPYSLKDDFVNECETDTPLLEHYLKRKTSVFQDERPISPPDSCPSTPPSSEEHSFKDLVNDSETDTSFLEHYLKRTAPAFQDDLPISPPDSCPPTPTTNEVFNSKDLVKEYKPYTPWLKHYLKQANPPQEITRPKRKCSNTFYEGENVKTKKFKKDDNDRSDVEIEKISENGDTSCHENIVKWNKYNSKDWCKLYDSSLVEMETPLLLVTCDKGFTAASLEDVFICQKKNHFQITLILDLPGSEHFIKVKDAYENVSSYEVHLYAVKAESPHMIVNVEQSTVDRSKIPYHPIKFPGNAVSRKTLTIARLHFSETTSNNTRKRGKINPDQRYFTLVVDIRACTKQGDYSVCRQASQKLIVRASNPGQFDNDIALWSKDKFGDSISRMSHVGINNDKPEECLTINGNFRLTGQILQPSDRRILDFLEESDTRQNLENVCALKLYKCKLKDDYAEYAGLSDQEEEQLEVVSQELGELIPAAVIESSNITLPSGTVIKDLQLVNKSRLFMESLGASQELFKMTKICASRLMELEARNKILEDVILANAVLRPPDKEITL